MSIFYILFQLASWAFAVFGVVSFVILCVTSLTEKTGRSPVDLMLKDFEDNPDEWSKVSSKCFRHKASNATLEEGWLKLPESSLQMLTSEQSRKFNQIIKERSAKSAALEVKRILGIREEEKRKAKEKIEETSRAFKKIDDFGKF